MPTTDPEPKPTAPRDLLLVVACALVDEDGRVLLAQRPQGKHLAGLWEFPGGKLGPGETPEACLIRELAEELGIATEAACVAPLTFASHAYERFHLLMPLYVCRKWRGEPRPLEGQAALRWVRARGLRELPITPAGVALIPFLEELL
jgi:8-oxo-dGTP diphosphatase